MRTFFLLLLAACIPGSSWALSPLSSFNDLVAGEGSPGLEDGPFYSALFQMPEGLAITPKATRLYVADRHNHCIRVVDLEHANQVSTLTGKNQPGWVDGPLAQAAFNEPALLVYLPNQKLAVYDYANARIRLIDLARQTVSTLAGNGTHGIEDGDGPQSSIGPLWSLVYSASEDAILFSQPEQGVLRKVDLKTGKVSTLLKKNETIPNPGALCVAHEKIYVADWKLGSVYEWIPKKGAAKDDPAPYELRLVYKAKSVVRAMASSEKNLYISQSDPTVPLVRLLPDGNPVPVTFLSVWGELLDKHYWAENFLGLNNGLPLGWVGDPTSDRKFYMANSNGNVVVSFRDLSQEELLNSESYNSSGITEFEYPLSKPPRTFRILLVGDSHTYHMYAADNQKRGMKYYNRMNGLSKRLELTLNTLASWEDAPIHFEVIHQGAVSWNPLNIWPYYEVPPTVKKYDIDLVLYMLIPTTDLGPYYAWPMTSQGIPTAKADPEYLLKPAKDRIPGGLPRKLYDLCKAKNIVTIFNNQVRFDNTQEMVQDPEILDCMTKLYSKPMRLLREKLEAPDFIPGKKVRMEICFFPLGHFQALRWLKPFFDKVLVEIGAPSLDISESFTPLRYSYYPFSEIDANDHMNTDGHMLMAFLLAHQLIREKVIPFAAPPGK